MERDAAAELFAHRLREHLRAGGWSVRGFGKKVDPDDPERGRRRVQRHLSGKHLPSEASRDSYVDALDIEPSELPLPSDAADEGVTREERLEFRRLALKLLEATA